jgi:hypothetical protein
MTQIKNSTNTWQRVQQIPRAYIYLLLAGVVVWQLLFPISLPTRPSAPSIGVYDAIRSVPEGKLIVLSTDWDASTQAETGPQTQAILHACFESGKRVAILNLSAPMGAKLANDIALRVAEKYGASYGVDWCNWGYKIGGSNVLLTLVRNIPEAIGVDFYGKRVTELPMMSNVRTARDIGLVIEITGLSGVIESWIGLVQGPYQTPFASGVTAVMAPGYYPFLDSGQMKGMLVGAKGAAEMEVLVRRPDGGIKFMMAQSWAHVLIILLIVLGNLGYIMARRRPVEEGR